MPSRVYPSQATVMAVLRVTDPGGLTDTDSVVISASSSPPVPVIGTPAAGRTAAVGEQITFSGSASDAQDGTLAASELSWSLQIEHCPSNCHAHGIQTFAGVASGSFAPPDHDYPSYLELILTATDSNGVSASVTRRIDPKTVNLSFSTVPTGLSLDVNGAESTAPFSRTVIQGSSNSITAITPRTVGTTVYDYSAWSEGGAATHGLTATSAGIYTATFTARDTDAPTGTVTIGNGAPSRDDRRRRPNARNRHDPRQPWHHHPGDRRNPDRQRRMGDPAVQLYGVPDAPGE